MEFSDVIKNRRSVRGYSDRAVEDEKLSNILESARWAPSWANKQCWHFIVIKDRGKIEQISKSSAINKWLKNSPVIILACAEPGLSGSRNGIDYFAVDVAISMEHLVLAAADLGLGTCWIGAFDEQKMKKVLDVPDHIKIVALTPVGYPAEKQNMREKMTRSIIKSSKRKPLNEIVHYNGW
jgi:nitroreductase